MGSQLTSIAISASQEAVSLMLKSGYCKAKQLDSSTAVYAPSEVNHFADICTLFVCSILWTQEGKTAMHYAKEKSRDQIFELLKQVLQK